VHSLLYAKLHDMLATSKWEAGQGLRAVCRAPRAPRGEPTGPRDAKAALAREAVWQHLLFELLQFFCSLIGLGPVHGSTTQSLDPVWPAHRPLFMRIAYVYTL
jgi:hypothetical protein